MTQVLKSKLSHRKQTRKNHEGKFSINKILKEKILKKSKRNIKIKRIITKFEIKIKWNKMLKDAIEKKN